MHTRVKACLIVLILTAAVFLAYGNSLGNGFVWDDIIIIEKNDFIKSWENIPFLFNQTYLNALSQGGSGECSYRPVTTFSFFIDNALWGLDPFWYHLENIILHLLNAVFMFILLKIITGRDKLSFWAALLFSVHPVTTEALDVISFREDPQMVLLCLLSFIFFIKKSAYAGLKKSLSFLMSLLLFFTALFTKETAACLILLFMLYDYLFTCGMSFKQLARKVLSGYSPYFIILLFYIIIRFFYIVATGQDPMLFPGGNFYTNLLTMSRVIGFYIVSMILPFNLPTIMPIDRAFVTTSFSNPWVLPSLLLITAFLFTAVRSRKKYKYISFGLFWFFITLLPVSNIFPIRNHVAVRYIYMPCVGFSIFLASALCVLSDKKYKQIIGYLPDILFILIASLFLVSTNIRNYYWKDNHIFIQKAVERQNDFVRARYVLAKSFESKGNIDDAIREYSAIIMIDPDNTGAYMHLGMCYVKKGKIASDKKIKDMYFNKAIKYFRYLLRFDPKNEKAFNNIGVCYILLGEKEEAADMWEKALEINPHYTEPERNLSRLSEEQA